MFTEHNNNKSKIFVEGYKKKKNSTKPNLLQRNIVRVKKAK